MPRVRALLLVPAVGAIAVAGLAACGSEDAKLLPGETAREITANLDTVKQLSDEGDCVGAESAAQQVGEQIEAIEGVDAKLKRALEGGATRLEEVIAECEEATEAVAPATVPTEPEEEKAAGEKRGKEKEPKPEREETAPEEPSLPPQAEGEGKGLENGNGPPASPGPPEGEAEAPSGGVSPSNPAGEGE
ncbi:MAG TPA: hypothetical protein VH703_00200 [Solirubrobacterales bacterium]|jgi:hypothetical protein